jgi:hypothetical protein
LRKPRHSEHEFAHASLCGRIALAHDGSRLVAMEEFEMKRNASSCLRMHVSYESYARMFLCSYDSYVLMSLMFLMLL